MSHTTYKGHVIDINGSTLTIDGKEPHIQYDPDAKVYLHPHNYEPPKATLLDYAKQCIDRGSY